MDLADQSQSDEIVFSSSPGIDASSPGLIDTAVISSTSVSPVPEELGFSSTSTSPPAQSSPSLLEGIFNTPPISSSSSSTAPSPVASPSPSLFSAPVDPAKFPEYSAWQNSHRAFIEDLKSKGAAHRQAAIDAGTKEAAQLQAEREKFISLQKERLIEKAYVQSRDKTLSEGNDWERVAALCDLSKTAATKDVSRLKQVLKGLAESK